MNSICTIVLNYNNFTDTYECIKSLLEVNNKYALDNTIILVDNASTDNSGLQLSSIFSDSIIYLNSSRNVGYAAGNNLGIKYALNNDYKYVCVLNNDTYIENDFLTPCITCLENDDVAFVSPIILNYSDGLVQSTGGDIDFVKGDVPPKNYGKTIEEIPENIISDYLGGACMIFRTSLIDLIGLIPENYFLFFEETEWCLKAKRAGKKNVCIKSASVKHKGSVSIDAVDGLHAYLMERNRIVFLRRNSPSFISFCVAVSFLVLRCLAKGFFEDKVYFSYLKSYSDGLKNRVDQKRFPFIEIQQ